MMTKNQQSRFRMVNCYEGQPDSIVNVISVQSSASDGEGGNVVTARTLHNYTSYFTAHIC